MFITGSVIACLMTPVSVPPPIHRWESLVRRVACRQHVDPRLVLAVMLRESGGRWNAKNRQAVGLMQIKVGTARMLGYRGTRGHLFRPAVNVFYGVKYLAQLVRRYTYGWDAVSAYNCGRPHWRKGRGFMCQGRKTEYVKKVAETYTHLRVHRRKRVYRELFASATVYQPFLAAFPVWNK